MDKVSLIIPVKNEEGSIGPLLDSIFSQEMLPDEVIITDGGSSDRTTEIINEYMSKDYPIRLIANRGAYPGKARNIAIEAAKNSVIASTDAGIELDRRWLKELLNKVEDDPAVQAVFGSYEPRRDTLFKKCSSLAFVPPREKIDGRMVRTFFVASMLFKKDVWAGVGGFPNLRSAEDRIFMEKIRDNGYKVAFAPEALATWDIPRGPKELFDRFCLYSYHGIKAGRMRDWHLPVMRIYAVLLIIMLLAFLLSPVLLFALPALFAARAFNLIMERCEGSFLKRLDPVQFSIVLFSMILIDMAMFCGAVKYIFKGISNEPKDS
jgi:glycosyltransferase involved in cell wall biosynthesis